MEESTSPITPKMEIIQGNQEANKDLVIDPFDDIDWYDQASSKRKRVQMIEGDIIELDDSDIEEILPQSMFDPDILDSLVFRIEF